MPTHDGRRWHPSSRESRWATYTATLARSSYVSCCSFFSSLNYDWKSVVDVVPREVRSRMMASIRARDTKPEMLVRRHLHGSGFRYRLSPRDLPGKPDLVLPRHNVVVLVHGCFWHGHPGCRFARLPATRTEFWTAKLSANRNRDAAAEGKLRDLGWRVAIVWECALRSNQSDALQGVTDFIVSNRAKIEIAG